MIFWPRATEKHRVALLRIVAGLFVLAGLVENGTVATLPRRLRNHVLRILRPAESAARRLIVIAARGVEVKLRPLRARKGPPSSSVILGLEPRTHSGKPGPATGPKNFPLIDPRKRFDLAPRRRYAKTFPRITCIGLSEPTPVSDDWFPSPDDPVSAERLCRRLDALKRALEDLDGQARRLARWRGRDGQNGKSRLPPMRPGWPPGHRRRPSHEVDDVLRECHSLAVYAQRPDTS